MGTIDRERIQERRTNRDPGCSLRALLVLMLLLILTACTSAPQVSLAHRAGFEALPASRVGDFFLVDAFANGKGPYHFLVDTGSSHTVLDEGLMRDMAMDAVSGEDVLLRSLSCGSLSAQNLRVKGMDLSAASKVLGQEVDGLIGFDVWSELVLKLDYQLSQVAVSMPRNSKEQESGDHRLPLVGRGRPYINLEIQGQSNIFVLDSGSSLGFGLINLKRYAWSKPPKASLEVVTDVGKVSFQIGRLKGNVNFAGHILKEPTANATRQISGVGTAILKTMRVTVDAPAGYASFEQ